MITDTQLADLIEAVKDEAGRFPSTDMIHVELAAVRELKELRAELAPLKSRLAEIAGECAECGGTGSVQCGDDPTGKPAMFPCDACWDIRALCF